MARLVSVFVLVMLAATGFGAEGYQFPPDVRGDMVARLEVKVAEAGDAASGVVTLTVKVEGGQTLEVAAARLDDPTDAWTARRTVARVTKDGRATSSQSIELRQVKPGFPSVPAVTVRFRAGPGAEWEEAAWVNILQEAREAPPPEPVALEETARPVWPFLVAAVVGAALATAWLRRRPRPAPPLSPEESAGRELDAIERAGLGPVAQHHRLSDVVRGYLAERWQLPAPRQTTAEFLEAYGAQVPGPARAALAEFLHRCDLAKFAAVEPGPDDCRATALLARSILKACEPAPTARNGPLPNPARSG